MAKVKPSLKSDEDSAVEFSKSASESDRSPQEDLYRNTGFNLLSPYRSDSDFSEDDSPSSTAISSTSNMAQLFPRRGRSTPRRNSVRFENTRCSVQKGRKRSVEDDESILEEELSRASQKHQSKNAINARINRIKKKKYMLSLEDSLSAYKNECKRWQGEYRQKSSEVQVLQNEVKYLKAVLRHQSQLSDLVKNLSYCGKPVLAPTKACPSKTDSFPLKGTNLLFMSNVDSSLCSSPSFPSSNAEMYSDIISNDTNIISEPINFDSNHYRSSSASEDIAFKTVFPSACDYFNFDLPESFEESSLLSPTNFGDAPCVDRDPLSPFEDVGICLHISTVTGISMEFCSQCCKSTVPDLEDESLVV